MKTIDLPRLFYLCVSFLVFQLPTVITTLQNERDVDNSQTNSGSTNNKVHNQVKGFENEGNGSHGVFNDYKENAKIGLLGDRHKRSLDKKLVAEMIMATAVHLQYAKFFDFDHRFESEDAGSAKKPAKRGAFLKSFPIPPLLKLHVVASSECDMGFWRCLQRLNHYSTHTHFYQFLVKTVREGKRPAHRAAHDFLAQAKERKELVHQPFKTQLEAFQFRISAMYYMCWYTMQKISYLARFQGPCRYWLQDDYRTNNNKDFDCALFSFCPDVCCGSVMGYGTNIGQPEVCWNNKKNPCNAVHDGRCLVDFNHNQNFLDLRENKINYTCACDIERNGYLWNPTFGLCVEHDECFTNNHMCARDKLCRNTLGGYVCTCRRGYTKARNGHCFRDPRAALIVVDDTTEAPKEEVVTEEPNPFGIGKPVVDKVYDMMTHPKGGSTRSQDVKWWLAWITTGVSTWIVKRVTA